MTAAPWRLSPDGQLAKLAWGALTAEVNLAAPERGLVAWRQAGVSLGDLAILGWRLASEADDPRWRLDESYVRGVDLVATYETVHGQPLRAQLYWRATAGDGGALGVELIVSVQTSILDAQPRSTVQSSASPSEVWRLSTSADGDDAAIAPCEIPPPGGALSLAGSGGWLLRPAASPAWSYLEAAHPSDFESAVLAVAPGGELQLSWRLFSHELEKGVIRRARVRGMLLPRTTDTSLAPRELADFFAAAPPLTV